MFIPDVPISTATEDRLNRAYFAQKLAETIRDWTRDESIVIALYGPWGSGKTSILNLAIDHIYSSTQDWKDKKAPIVIRFNPWNFSEQTQLLLAFFQQLYAAIIKIVPDKKKRKELEKHFSSFVKTLSGVEVIGDIPVVGKWIQGSAKIVSVFFPEKALEDQKKDLVKLFREIDRRVIVVIDDIDRLTDQEIRQLFQLIKINGDFPNTMYLVAFDRNVVEKALDKEQGIKGRDYLEKIVQVGFDIPATEIYFVEQELFRELDKILTNVKINQELWDQIRWGNMYHGGIRPLFQSLRDVKRYVNGLSFNLQLVAGEVNPIDFIGLEALRIFIPEIYTAVANNKLLFTQAINLLSANRNPEKIKEQLEKLFLQAPDEIREFGRQICFLLFPKVADLYQPMFGGDYRQPNWRQARRICSEDVFDFYFTLGTPKGEISRSELGIIAQTASNPANLLEIFRKLAANGKFPRLLGLLPDIHSQLNSEDALGLCQALIVFGDEFPNEHRGFPILETDVHMALELNQVLHSVKENERADWFQEQLVSGRSLYMLIYVLWQDSPQEGKQRENPLFPEEQHERLRRVCIEEIEKRAKLRTLQKTKRLSLIMFRWRDWAQNKEPISEFCEFLLSSSKNALDLLVGFLTQANRQSISDYIGSTEWFIDLKNLGEFIDLKRLEEITDLITEEEAKAMSDKHWQALNTFRSQLKNPSPLMG